MTSDREYLMCSGKVISGSGGHRVHGQCSRIANYMSDEDIYSYCEEHILETDLELLAWDYSEEGFLYEL